jgi:tetratricopeptide (TPR) repeat protein
VRQHFSNWWLTVRKLLLIIILTLTVLLSRNWLYASVAYLKGNNALSLYKQGGSVGDLDQAAIQFALVTQLQPQSSEARCALAHIYSLRGQFEDAIIALEQAYRLNPTSLIIQYRLIDAYESAGNIKRADMLLAQAGQTSDGMIRVGDFALSQQKYALARSWYDRALRSGAALTASLALRQAVATAYNGEPEAVMELSSAAQAMIPLLRLSTGQVLKVNGSSFMRFDGSYLIDAYSDQSGVFWWSGPALSIIDLPQAGRYLIKMKLWHGIPPPIEMSLAINGQVVNQVTLTRADQSWQIVTVEVVLESGPQVVLINFLNDGSLRGADRNARIGWLSIEKLSS